MLIEDILRHLRLRIQQQCFQRHLRHGIQHNSVIHRCSRILAPGERPVVPDNDARHRQRRNSALIQRFRDDLSGVQLIVRLDLRLRQRAGTRYGAVEIIRMRRSERGNIQSRLRKCDRIHRMRMRDAADFRIAAVQLQMRFRIRGRIPFALGGFAALQIHNDHILRLHAVIIHTGRLDHDKSLFAVDAADIAPGIDDNASCGQLQIGCTHSLLQCFQHIRTPLDHWQIRYCFPDLSSSFSSFVSFSLLCSSPRIGRQIHSTGISHLWR